MFFLLAVRRSERLSGAGIMPDGVYRTDAAACAIAWPGGLAAVLDTVLDLAH
jgi:hypothetical protein